MKTKEALKEEKLQRKEEEKRRYSGNNNDFLASVGISDVATSQNRRIRLRRTSQTVSECSDGGGISGGVNFSILEILVKISQKFEHTCPVLQTAV